MTAPAARVAFAISHSEHAGAQVIWADLAAAFRRRGHAVSLLALYPGRGELPPPGEGLDWEHCLDHTPRSAADAVRAVRAAAGLLRRFRPDAVFTALPAANVVFPLAGLAAGRPAAFTSHHSPVSTYNPAYRRLDALVGATVAVAGVVCVSDAVRASLPAQPRARLAKSTVIRNALPPAVEALTAALRHGRRGRGLGRTVVACGRLAAQKNHSVLIRAMAHVERAQLKLVGAGPAAAALRALAAQCGVAGRVQFLGLKPREETLILVAAGDVFVQPSLFEGHSLALLEAARIGIPMVVSDIPSQVEAVTRRDGTRCALLHGVHDHLALAAAISSLLDTPVVRDRYQALSASLGDENSFADMVDAYEALLAADPVTGAKP